MQYRHLSKREWHLIVKLEAGTVNVVNKYEGFLLLTVVSDYSFLGCSRLIFFT